MKKIISILTVIILCFAIIVPMSASAASASATLIGTGTVRAGDTVTLNFNLNGSGIYGVSGTLSYDSSKVSITGTKQAIASPWMVEFNGNNFVAYDNNLTNPINKNTTVFTVTFKVKEVNAGEKINISYTGVTASDGNSDINVGTAAYSVTVAAPLSKDNTLESLTVSNAKLSPSFSKDVTSYKAEVGFDVSKLNVNAKAKDSKAVVSVSNPTLTPGGTTDVKITVKAENGDKKVYTISVKRAQDPNYVASNNTNVSGITVDGFMLSPAFNVDTTQYVVWLPFEQTNIRINGTAQDSKASVEVQGGENLAAGQDNIVKVICTAENGDKKTYTVVVKRAAGHDGTVEELPEQPSVDADTNADEAANGGIAWWWTVVAGVAGIALGAVVVFVIFSSKKKEQ